MRGCGRDDTAVEVSLGALVSECSSLVESLAWHGYGTGADGTVGIAPYPYATRRARPRTASCACRMPPSSVDAGRDRACREVGISHAACEVALPPAVELLCLRSPCSHDIINQRNF